MNNTAATIDNIIRFKNGNLRPKYYKVCYTLKALAVNDNNTDTIKIYPNSWIRKNGSYKLLSFESDLLEILKACGVKYRYGNDKRGGLASDYYEIKKPDHRLSFWKFWRAFEWDTQS